MHSFNRFRKGIPKTYTLLEKGNLIVGQGIGLGNDGD